MANGLILLDRDGVLNDLFVHPELGVVDSPLNVEQVAVFPWVASALAKLTRAGYGLCIVTNQPAAAKKKTTRTNLEAVHARIVQESERDGARILSSHICWHRHEDGCACRKPKPGMLQDALKLYPQYDKSRSWMVGDGVTDVEAGLAAGVKTGFFGPLKCDMCKVLEKRALKPDFRGQNLEEFTCFLLEENRGS